MALTSEVDGNGEIVVNGFIEAVQKSLDTKRKNRVVSESLIHNYPL